MGQFQGRCELHVIPSIKIGKSTTSLSPACMCCEPQDLN